MRDERPRSRLRARNAYLPRATAIEESRLSERAAVGRFHGRRETNGEGILHREQLRTECEVAWFPARDANRVLRSAHRTWTDRAQQQYGGGSKKQTMETSHGVSGVGECAMASTTSFRFWLNSPSG